MFKKLKTGTASCYSQQPGAALDMCDMPQRSLFFVSIYNNIILRVALLFFDVLDVWILNPLTGFRQNECQMFCVDCHKLHNHKSITKTEDRFNYCTFTKVAPVKWRKMG